MRSLFSEHFLTISLSFCCGVVLTAAFVGWRNPPLRLGDGRRTSQSVKEIVGASGRGTQLVAVVVGSSRLGSLADRAIVDSLRGCLGAARELARGRNLELVSIGSAVDQSPDVGLRWLSRIGDFDEVVAGQGWTGTAAQSFLWNLGPSQPSVPQILVFLRNVRAISETELVVTQSTPLLRLRGVRELARCRTEVTQFFADSARWRNELQGTR